MVEMGLVRMRSQEEENARVAIERAAAAATEALADLDATVQTGRAIGLTWADVGRAVGITRQSARERWGEVRHPRVTSSIPMTS